MNSFQLTRLGIIMEPEAGNALEVEGVLNPAVVRGPDKELYIFPRMVSKGNYSRIGIGKVRFDSNGDPVDVERLGIALEPEAPYEKRPDGGGCEDPRITYVAPLEHYVMTYTAFSSNGPRIALAQSKDLFHWDRLGLATFGPFEHIDFNGVNNKDASMFPAAIESAHGHLSMAMLHRPLFPGTSPEETALRTIDKLIREHHECIWISYCHLHSGQNEPFRLPVFTSNQPLAIPSAPWEKLKIGAGTPPILTRYGWLILYHGVSEETPVSENIHHLCYSAGVMIFNKEQPHIIVYRSQKPVLSPDLPEEKVGTISNVVFPTGIDCREDIGMPDRYDVYYGMADNRIGVARMDLPASLPET